MTFRGQLRPYQAEPVQRMVERGNMLLAMEQGTGKTPSVVAAIEQLRDENRLEGTGLWVTLATLKYQTAEKIEQFSDQRALVIDGTPKQRGAQYAEAALGKHTYVVLSYSQLVDEWDQVAQLGHAFIVVDEASYIKGFKSKRTKAVKELRAPYRFALTGTPIENGKPEELFSIMEFVDKGVFGSAHIFDRTFVVRNSQGWVTRYRNLPTFHNRMQPALVRLRATDPDVAAFMPKRYDEPPMRIPLDAAGRKLYNHIVNELLVDLEAAAAWGGSIDVGGLYGQASGPSSSSQDRLRGRIGSKMLALEMLCDHPELLSISARKFSSALGGSAYIENLRSTGMLDGLTKAPKRVAATRWVNDILDRDPRNKVVIFSRFVDMVDILSRSLPGCETYTGEMNAKEKHKRLTHFQQSPHVRVLVSSDAGGFGLDIPEANYLLNYDEPHAAGTAEQRNTRILRTSSTFPSCSINWMMVAGSLEEFKHIKLRQKLSVADAFLDGVGINNRGSVLLDAGSLTAFLRQGSV